VIPSEEEAIIMEEKKMVVAIIAHQEIETEIGNTMI
jgi:hypothetical protein